MTSANKKKYQGQWNYVKREWEEYFSLNYQWVLRTIVRKQIKCRSNKEYICNFLFIQFLLQNHDSHMSFQQNKITNNSDSQIEEENKWSLMICENFIKLQKN